MRFFVFSAVLLLLSCGKEEVVSFDESITYASDFVLDPATGDTLYAIHLPGGFTPNGDGLNDVYFVRGTGIDSNEYALRVYDRDNNYIYTIDDPNDGWPGCVQGHGEYVQAGIYKVEIDVADTMGNPHSYSYYINMVK